MTSGTVRWARGQARSRVPRCAARTIGAALVVATLAACAGSPGSAAVVDGRPITESALADAVADWGQLTTAAPASVLQELIISPFIVDAAAAAGVGASEEDARDLLAREAERAGLDPASLDVGPGLLLVGRRFVAQERAAEAGVTQAVEAAAIEALGEAHIEVSPRYGTWGDLGITALARPWLVGAPTQAP